MYRQDGSLCTAIPAQARHKLRSPWPNITAMTCRPTQTSQWALLLLQSMVQPQYAATCLADAALSLA